MNKFEEKKFKPTAAQHFYAYQRAKMGDNISETKLSTIVGIARETISRWKSKPGFMEWMEEQQATYRAPILDMLEQVAIENIRDYKYWEALAEKYGYKKAASSSLEENVQNLLKHLNEILTPAQWAVLDDRAKELKNGDRSAFRSLD